MKMKLYISILFCFILNSNVLSQEFSMHVNLSSKDQIDQNLLSPDQKYFFTGCRRQNEIKVWDLQQKANIASINTKTISTLDHSGFQFDINQSSKNIIILFPSIKKIFIYDFIKCKIISEHDLSNNFEDPENSIFYVDDETVYMVDNTIKQYEVIKYNLKTKTKQIVKKYLKENQLYLQDIKKTNENIICFFQDSTNFLVQSSNDKLLLTLKRTEKFEKIVPIISKNEKYIAINFTDHINLFNIQNKDKVVTDSIKKTFGGYYPTYTRFSDDCKNLLYLDNENERSDDTNQIVVYDLEQQKTINILDMGGDEIHVFHESKERVFATNYHEIYSGYLYHKKLQKTLKGLQRQTSYFIKSDEYWLSGFDNGSINIFNTKTGENNFLKITPTKNHYAPVNIIRHYDNTILLSVKKKEANIIYKIALNELKVIDSLYIFNKGKIKNLTLDAKKEYLWVEVLEDTPNRMYAGNEDITPEIIRNRLFDIKTFKEIPLFENHNYDNLYFTDDKKQLVGYVSNKGSYVYDSKNYKFIKFIPNSLYFKHKENNYELIKELNDNLVKDFEVDCESCEDGYKLIDSIFKIPSGKIILKKDGLRINEFDNLNKSPKSDDDIFLHKIIHNNNTFTFSKNGFESLFINIEKKSTLKPKKISKYILKFNNPKPFYLKFDTLGNDATRNIIKSNKINFKIADTLAYSIYNIGYLNEELYLTKNFAPKDGGFEWYNNGYDKYGNIKIEVSKKIDEEGIHEVFNEDSEDCKIFDEEITVKLNSLYHDSYYNKELGIAGEFYKIPSLTLEDRVFLNKTHYNFHKKYYENYSTENVTKTENYLVELFPTYLFDEDDKTSPYSYNFSDIKSYYDWDSESNSDFNFNWDENKISIRATQSDSTKVNFNFIILENNNFIIYFDDNYYMATKEIFDYLWFSNNDKIARPEQFDLKYNRPDIVMERLGYADKNTIEFLKNLYLKRLKKIGIKESQLSNSLELPTLKIKNFEKLSPITNSKEIGLNLQINDKIHKLKSINIWINNTPIYGKNGIDISMLKTKKLDKNLLIPLAYGSNKIQLSILNEIGSESLKETIYIESTQSNVKQNLYLVTLGVSTFENTDYNLKYAAKDALDIKNLFLKSKLYNSVYTKTLTDTEVTQNNIIELKSFLKDATINDVVMIYIASHGILDKDFNYYIASHNIDFNNPIRNGIAYENIEKLLDEVKPLKKIMFIDACHSGEVDVEEIEIVDKETANGREEAIANDKRGSKALNVKKKNIEQIKDLNIEIFSDLRRGNGTTIISSAGGLESALESDKWQNGLFTFCLMNGLTSKKADLNNDGNIMLSEIQNYVSNQVIEISNGTQQPTFRLQNLAIDYQIW